MTIRLTVLIFAGVMAISMLAQPQDHGKQSVKGRIEGNIHLSDGTAAANMQLFVEATESNYQEHVRTDNQGRYYINDVPLGELVLYPYDTSKLYPLRADMFLS